jgi:hypothetical protein
MTPEHCKLKNLLAIDHNQTYYTSSAENDDPNYAFFAVKPAINNAMNLK